MLTLGPIMSSSLSSTTACGVWYIAWGKFEWLHGGRVKGVCIVHNILHSSRLTKWGMVGLSPWECLVRSWSWAVWGCFSLICASDDLMGFSFFLCIRWIDTYIHTQTHTYIHAIFFLLVGHPRPRPSFLAFYLSLLYTRLGFCNILPSSLAQVCHWKPLKVCMCVEGRKRWSHCGLLSLSSICDQCRKTL